MLKNARHSPADLMRAEEYEVMNQIPRFDPDTADEDTIRHHAGNLQILTDRVLAWKDEADAWLRRARGQAYGARQYQEPTIYNAFVERQSWAKRTHQDLLIVTAAWTRAAKRLKTDAAPARVANDIGAMVIERAYRYRSHRTPANGAALDAALDLLASASTRWSDFRNGLE